MAIPQPWAEGVIHTRAAVGAGEVKHSGNAPGCRGLQRGLVWTAVAQDQSSPGPDGNSLGLFLALSAVQESMNMRPTRRRGSLCFLLRRPRAPRSAGELHQAPKSNFLLSSYFYLAFKAELRTISRQSSLLKRTKKYHASTCGAETVRKRRLAGWTNLQASLEQEDGLGP